MNNFLRKSTLTLTLAAALGGSWSNSSFACSSDPYISSVCVLAAAKSFPFDYYVPAVGTQLSVNQYQAIFSLLGTTYGGDGSKTFNLPDLRGRVILGAGQYADTSGSKIYYPGQTGGLMASSGSVTLTAANLPPHVHTLSPSTATSGAPNGVTVSTGIGTLAVSLSGLTTTTGAGTLAGTFPIASVSASTVASTLSLNGSTGSASATANQTPNSNFYLGSPAAKIYNSATPIANLAPGSLSGTGTIPVSFTGTNIAITGAPTVTVTGTGSLTGAPAVAVGGQTNSTGTGAPATVNVPSMTPYLVMNYFFATQGMYPMFNN